MLEASEPTGLSGGLAPGTGGAGGAPPGGGGGAPGGFGAAPRGGVGTELRVSGSDIYGDLVSAPVFTPPDFLNFGMPPANSPPSCGGAAMALSPPVSLLLLARFPPPGTGGASPPGGAGGLPIPGTGGAPPIAGAASLTFPTCGADRSLTTVFFSFAPLVMSPSSAPCRALADAHAMLLPSHSDMCYGRILRRDVLFLHPTAASLLAPSCQASVVAGEVHHCLVPSAAWAEGEVEDRASCRMCPCWPARFPALSRI